MHALPWLLLIALSSATVAAESSFRTLDLDRDGQLSAREVPALPVQFHALDTDGNGYLSRSEFQEAEIEARQITNQSEEETHRAAAHEREAVQR